MDGWLVAVATRPAPTAVAPGKTAQDYDRYAQAFMLDPAKFAIAGGFAPDGWQVRFLRSRAKRRMLNCSRQTGKSTVVAWGAAHKAVYFPNSLTLLLSPGERQSKELMIKVKDALAHAPNAPALVTSGKEEVEFTNGSRILALPGTEQTVRGYSAVDLLVVDEASRVADELYASIRPMLATSQGELWTLSSPYGKRGWWYEQYSKIKQALADKRRPPWEYYEIPATVCPRITAEFLAEELEALGEWWYKQEYFCEFMNAAMSAFGEEEITAAFNEDVIPWYPDASDYEP